MAGLLGVSVAGCAARRDMGPPVNASADALQSYRERAETPSRQQALDNLRLASVAMATGDQDTAEQALRRASALMTTFQSDGEFRAAVGAEQSKDWKGEPYEKMAAFLELGVLLQAEGDRGNALAMYKSAVLADTGTAEDRYRSDFVPGWVMQALAYQAEREDANARQSMERAVDAWWSRYTMDGLTQALAATQAPSVPSYRQEVARAMLSEALAAGVTAKPRDPMAAADATIALAPDIARVQRDKKRKERLGVYASLKPSEVDFGLQDLGAVAKAWTDQVASMPELVGAEGQTFARRMEALLREQPKVVLLVEGGQGPTKVRMGSYGEVLTIVPGKEPPTPAVVLDGAALDSVRLDSLSYQATTRGSRRVDGFLKGKAVYKDTSMITGYVLLRTAEIAAWSDNDDLAIVAAILGGGLFLSGALTNPKADIRAWREVPETWFLVTANPAPGTHQLQLRGRTYTLEVPERGQLVAYLTSLPPYGAERIAPRVQP